jgi:hypothetical protein
MHHRLTYRRAKKKNRFVEDNPLLKKKQIAKDHTMPKTIPISRKTLEKTLAKAAHSGKYPAKAHLLLPQEYTDKPRFDLEAFRERIAALPESTTLDDILPANDTEDHYNWSYRMFCALALAKSAIPEGSTTHHESSLTIKKPLYIHGDLKIDGDLQIGKDRWEGHRLVITGDLDITGNLRIGSGAELLALGDMRIGQDFLSPEEWSLMIILGKATIKKRLISSGELFIGGKLDVPFVSLSYNHGQTNLLDGVEAKIFLESDHGGQIWGKTKIGFAMCQDMRGLPEKETASMWRALKKHIAPNALKEILDEAREENEDAEENELPEIILDSWDIIDKLDKLAEEDRLFPS